MKAFRTEGLRKSFGDIQALDGVDMEAGEGEILGVLGPNGAGKSTLIKVLTGQTGRDSGEVNVLGLDPGIKSKEVRNKTGILPEREDPPSFLTGREYLEMVSDVRGEVIDIDEWVERLNLEGKLDKLSRDLSKGERQKLMLVQAVFHRPDLVFIDEPLINLDPLIQEGVKDILKQHRERGGTVLLCTHVVSLAEEVCDRVVFLEDGEVIDRIDKPENLKQRFLEKE